MDWNIVGNGNLEKSECGHVETGDPLTVMHIL